MGVRDLQRVFVPMAKGLDQSRDDYTKAADTPVKLENGQLEKSGRLTKRKGFERQTSKDQDGTAITEWRGCFSTGKEVCFIGRQHLYAWDQTWDRHLLRGPVGPFVAHQKDVWREVNSVAHADTSATNGYTLHGAIRRHNTSSTSTVADNRIAAYVVSDTGSSSTKALDFATGTSNPYQLRAFHVDKTLGLLAIYGASTPGTLSAHTWDTESPSDLFSLTTSTTITADCLLVSDRRTFDAIGLPDGTCAIAYIDDTNQYVNLAIYDDSMSVVVSAVTITVNAPYLRVALSWDVANQRVNVLALAAGTEGNGVLEAHAHARSNLASVWGPITIATESVGADFDSLGCASDNGRMMCTWLEYSSRNSEPLGTTSIDFADVRLSDGGDKQDGLAISNAFPLSRPFYLEGHFYVAGGTNVTGNVWDSTDIHDIGGTNTQAAPYEIGAVWRLPASSQTHWQTTNTLRRAHVVAAYDVGIGPGTKGLAVSQWTGDVGCGQNVIIETDSDDDVTGFRVVLPAENEVFYSGSTSFTSAQESGKYLFSELHLDATALPNALGLDDGSGVVGGSLTCWYDGAWCHELHILVPPITYSGALRTDSNSPGLTGSTTYQWVGIWQCVDEQGRIHRSNVSLPVTATTTAEDTWRSSPQPNPVTNRVINEQSPQWLLYRDDGNSPPVYRRAMRAKDVVYVGEEFDDYLQINISEDDSEALAAIPLYTTGGNLPTVAPPGSNAMAVVGGRLLLGDFPRRVRVQYSKPFRAGTETEDLIAPEFNPFFQYVLERGNRITGLADLDGRWLIFTDVDLWVNAGNGPTDNGLSNDFTGPQRLNSDTGCKGHRSVVSTPIGVMFRGDRGIYLVDRAQEVSFVGFPVVDETDAYPEVTSAVLMPKLSQVRFTCLNADRSEGIVLVYDYAFGAWFKWVISDRHGRQLAPIGACNHKGRYVLCEADGTVWQQSETSYYDDTQAYVSLRVRTAPLTVTGPGGWQRFKRVLPLCRREDSCTLHVDLYRDFATEPTERRKLTSGQIALLEAPAERLQPKLIPAQQKAQAMAVEIYDTEADDTDPDNGQGYSCNGIMVGVQPKRTLARTSKRGRL